MNQDGMTLAQLGIGESCVVTSVGGEGALRQHFLDMGVIPGARVTLVKYAPMGDPMELLIHGYSLTLRLDDAAQIAVKPSVEEAPAATAPTPASARRASSTPRAPATPCPTIRPSPLRLSATRTAARPRFSTN